MPLLRRARPEIAGWINILWDETVWSFKPEFCNLTQTGSYCERVNKRSCCAVDFTIAAEAESSQWKKRNGRNESWAKLWASFKPWSSGLQSNSLGCRQLLSTFPTSSSCRKMMMGQTIDLLPSNPSYWTFPRWICEASSTDSGKIPSVQDMKWHNSFEFWILYSFIAIKFVRPDLLTQYFPTSWVDFATILVAFLFGCLEGANF